jgi:hypothetical protein
MVNMNFKPPPNHGTDAQNENLELVDDYLLRVRHRAILPHFGSFISPEKNRSRFGLSEGISFDRLIELLGDRHSSCYWQVLAISSNPIEALPDILAKLISIDIFKKSPSWRPPNVAATISKSKFPDDRVPKQVGDSSILKSLLGLTFRTHFGEPPNFSIQTAKSPKIDIDGNRSNPSQLALPAIWRTCFANLILTTFTPTGIEAHF